jgi:hypothetical protein
MAHQQIAQVLRSLIREYEDGALSLSEVAQYVEACGVNVGDDQSAAGSELKTLAMQLALQSINEQEGNEADLAVHSLLLRVGTIADLLDSVA